SSVATSAAGVAGAVTTVDSVGAGSGAAGAADGAGSGAGTGFAALAAFFAAVASAFFAAASGFLFFLIKLRTVSDGCAPLLIQYSARSSLIVLLCPGFFGSYVPMISMNFPSRGLRLSATTTL